MTFPIHRPRRLRRLENLRRMMRETVIQPRQLIMPYFVTQGEGVRDPITSMPGNYRWSVDTLLDEIQSVADLQIPSVLLFGIPESKDAFGSSAHDPNEAVQRAIRAIKEKFPELVIVSDVCLCEYTSHGHCGEIVNQDVDNDRTLPRLVEAALSHARAGADMIAPSDMMDGRVGAIRSGLDGEGFDHIPIMSYAAKFSSAYYGPFRDAAGSAPSFGDRRSYQMDPANGREALREVIQDLEEGADIVMVKPALAYLDIVREVKNQFNVPIAAYNVSGEFAMVKAAAERGWIDEKRIVLESITSMIRAGCDLVITYHAKDIARWIQE